jgi:hypothetical protein
MEIIQKRRQGGAEYDVETEFSNAADVRTKKVHHGSDLCSLELTISVIVKGSPGYGNVEGYIAGPREL